MRKRQTFLLTIMSSDSSDACFCGRIKVISSGKTLTFTNPDELYAVIASEMTQEAAQQIPPPNREMDLSEGSVFSS